MKKQKENILRYFNIDVLEWNTGGSKIKTLPPYDIGIFIKLCMLCFQGKGSIVYDDDLLYEIRTTKEQFEESLSKLKSKELIKISSQNIITIDIILEQIRIINEMYNKKANAGKKGGVKSGAIRNSQHDDYNSVTSEAKLSSASICLKQNEAVLHSASKDIEAESKQNEAYINSINSIDSIDNIYIKEEESACSKTEQNNIFNDDMDSKTKAEIALARWHEMQAEEEKARLEAEKIEKANIGKPNYFFEIDGKKFSCIIIKGADTENVRIALDKYLIMVYNKFNKYIPMNISVETAIKHIMDKYGSADTVAELINLTVIGEKSKIIYTTDYTNKIDNEPKRDEHGKLLPTF